MCFSIHTLGVAPCSWQAPSKLRPPKLAATSSTVSDVHRQPRQNADQRETVTSHIDGRCRRLASRMDRLVSTSPEFNSGAVAGSAATILFLFLTFVVFPALWNRNTHSLSYWKLNLRTPMQPMWTNLGFWRTPKGDRIVNFDQACAALLREVVVASGILGGDLPTERKTRPKRSIAILDVGFGCGDQTWELARALEAPTWNEYRYVGLTRDPVQLDIAQQRQQREIDGANRRGVQLWPGSFRLFEADASRPEKWGRPVKAMVDVLGNTKFTDKWFLALDCLYRFSSSREAIFRYAARNMGANLMAFDMLINDKATIVGATLTRLLALCIGIPVRSFITESQYIEQLVMAGYDKESIKIKDVTYDVFPGLVTYLDRQKRALGPYGVSLGHLNVIRYVFAWFANSGSVRAAIVTAKLKEKGA